MSDPRRIKANGFGTRAIAAATRAPRVEQAPDSVPIYQTATFSSEDSAELGDVLSDRKAGYAYSRIDNPTSVALAEAVAELHGADAGFPFATGMAAAHAMLVSLVGAGDHIVAASALYGSVSHLIADRLRRLGIDSTFVDVTDLTAVEAAVRPNTRVLHV